MSVLCQHDPVEGDLRDALDEVRIKLARVEVFTGHKPDLCEARNFWSICRRGCRETPVQEPSRSNHPRLFRAALDALEGILNDIGLTPR
jgi:hypothetical protein